MMGLRPAAFSLILLLAGCGGLPRPFQDNPGANAVRLAQPPPSRLAVAQPTEAMLPANAAAGYADAMASALSGQEVPAISGPPTKGDWRLVLTAQVDGPTVTPMFTVFDSLGAQAGIQQGQPVPAAEWSAATPTTVQAAALSAAPGIADLLTRIEATRRASDPNSLLNRQARLRVPDVTGAPGDGNRQLAARMRAGLAELGLLVQDGPKNASDFTVAGDVKAVPIANNMTRIEIQWIVSDGTGEERGHILQLNEVRTGSLDRLLGRRGRGGGAGGGGRRARHRGPADRPEGHTRFRHEVTGAK